MANPGKQYHLPCKYRTEYIASDATGTVVFIESVKLGARIFRVNVYAIDVDYEDSYKQFIFEQECGGGDY